MIYHLVHSLLRDAEDINGYGLFSFLLFFGFFLGVILWTCRLKRNDLKEMGDLPFDAGEKIPTDNPQSEKL